MFPRGISIWWRFNEVIKTFVHGEMRRHVDSGKISINNLLDVKLLYHFGIFRTSRQQCFAFETSDSDTGYDQFVMYISHYWKWRITFLWSILAPFKTSELSTLDTTEWTLGTQHQTALPTLIWLLPFTEVTYMHYCWVYTKNCEHGFRLDPHSSRSVHWHYGYHMIVSIPVR